MANGAAGLGGAGGGANFSVEDSIRMQKELASQNMRDQTMLAAAKDQIDRQKEAVKAVTSVLADGHTSREGVIDKIGR